ncbi:rhomboid family protein [Patiriisocius marinus]|nr:rhomboid family intramembrane serine protease [Patiriisocius marinus]
MNWNNITYKFKSSGIVIQLIVINVIVFFCTYLGSFLFGMQQYDLASWFVLPDGFNEFIFQPWSFITYAFVHFGAFHLFFNMLWLFWFGPFVLNLFSTKRFITIYLLGAISGGLLYVLAYNLFPVFAGSRGYLLGASAAIRAIVVFIAAYSPNTRLRLFIWDIKLWHIAAVLVVLDLIQLPTSGNAGGLIAHLGGAMFGYLYATQLLKGNDIGAWFENFLEYFTTKKAKKKKTPFRKVHKNNNVSEVKKKSETTLDNQKKVDAILDKIGKSGYESLSKAEKDFLFKSGND